MGTPPRIDWSAARTHWLSQTPPRSFNDTARAFACTGRAVSYRAHREGWLPEAAAMDAEAAKRAKRKAIRIASERYADVVRLADLATTKTIDGIEDGSIELKAGDAAAYIKLMLLLDGEATERIDVGQVRSGYVLLIQGALPILSSETLSAGERREAFLVLVERVADQLRLEPGGDT